MVFVDTNSSLSSSLSFLKIGVSKIDGLKGGGFFVEHVSDSALENSKAEIPPGYSVGEYYPTTKQQRLYCRTV